MYQWLLFLHLAAVLAFMLAHGAHVTIMWAWRGEADPERGLTLFNGLPTTRLTRILGVAVIVTGLVVGFVVPWWRQWWMWLSLVILAGMWVAMYRWGAGYFGLIQAAAERVVEERKSGADPSGALGVYDRVRRGWQPVGMMVSGIGGLAVILWLMIFKPF